MFDVRVECVVVPKYVFVSVDYVRESPEPLYDACVDLGPNAV